MEHSPFNIRGVIEGFYGSFYTFPERNDLIRFIGKHGYNLYIYGPKNDRQHRHRWWEFYPQEILDQFAETVAIAASVGVQFCYATGPIAYDSTKDFPRLVAKLRSLYDCGVRSFSILVDDIMCTLHGNPYCKICPRPADPHVDVCNRLYAWLQSLDSTCTLSMCPSEYHGEAPFSAYLHDLGARLHPEIDIFYTGPDVCSPEIRSSHVRDFAAAIGRAPLIWDNYPVNDLAMRPYMHIGPIRGRDADLYQAVRGVVVNPMLQPEASKIPLLTFADYFSDPHGYDPEESWRRALVAVGGKDNYDVLMLFAENSRQSCLVTTEATKLESLTNAAILALKNGEQLSHSRALQTLRDYLESLDEGCYVLKNRAHNLRLRDNLLPWIEALDEWVWIGKRSMLVLEAMETGSRVDLESGRLERALEQIKALTKQVAGNVLQPLGCYVLELAEQHEPRSRVPQAVEPEAMFSSAA